MPTCEEHLQRLLAFLDGDMDAREAKELEEHLSDCPPCGDFMKSYRATPGLCRKHLVKQMPHQLADHLKTFLRNKLQGS